MNGSTQSTIKPNTQGALPFVMFPGSTLRNRAALKLDVYEQATYSTIVDESTGYRRKWTDCLSHDELARLSVMGRSSAQKAVSSLLERKLIRRHKCGHGYVYQVVWQPPKRVLPDNSKTAKGVARQQQRVLPDNLKCDSIESRNGVSNAKTGVRKNGPIEKKESTGVGGCKPPPPTPTSKVCAEGAASAGPTPQPLRTGADNHDDEPLLPGEGRQRITNIIAMLNVQADDNRIGSSETSRTGDGKPNRALVARRRRQRWGDTFGGYEYATR